MIDVIPGIFEKDWTGFAQKVTLVAPYTKWVHVDILDGSMVEGVTLTDFSQLSTIKGTNSSLSFEAHLIVATPEKYIKPLADAGFSRLIAHVEANDPRHFLAAVKFEEVEVGLALDGTTEIDQIEPFLEEVDFVTILSAEVGGPDQPFLPETIEKVKLLRQNYPDLPIEVVDGITDKTARSMIDAGATRLVSSAFIYRDPASIGHAIEELKNG